MRRTEPLADLRAELQRPRRPDAAAPPQFFRKRHLAAALVDEKERLHQVHAGEKQARDMRMVQLGYTGKPLRLFDESFGGNIRWTQSWTVTTRREGTNSGAS